jgi:uncharacterized coiled-coil protein SlyX
MSTPEERLVGLKASLIRLEDTIETLSKRLARDREKLDSVGLRLKALVEKVDAREPPPNIINPLQTSLLVISQHYKAAAGDPTDLEHEGVICKTSKSVLSSWKRKWPIRRTRSSS